VRSKSPHLPLIYLLESLGEADKAEVVAVLRDHPDGFRTAVRRRLVQTDAMARAERKAQSYVLNALEVLEPLPKSPATRRCDNWLSSCAIVNGKEVRRGSSTSPIFLARYDPANRLILDEIANIDSRLRDALSITPGTIAECAASR